MQFCSEEFLFCFLPLFLAVYYAVPQRFRNAVLALGSVLFYGLGFFGELWQTGLLLGLTGISFVAGRLQCRWKSKVLLGLYLGVLAAVLAFFKLYEGGRWLAPGMSFYMFQMAAFLVEARRREALAKQSLLDYSTQILMFPKLLSGPICSPVDLWQQIWSRGYLPERFHEGLQQLILGIAMKTVLADRLGGLWSQAAVVGYDGISTPFAWMALVCYALRLYLDFFSYSLMAQGLGGMLGFRLPRNFRDPYWAKSVSEFYRRWHITLGAWFREYIYIPLGGSRRGTVRTVCNLAVVWLLTGLWHGIGWGYLIWAGFLFFCIVNERLWLKKLLDKWPLLGHVYTPFVIVLSWVPFGVVDPGQCWIYLQKLFGVGAVVNPMDYVNYTGRYAALMLGGLLLCTPLPEKLWNRVKDRVWADVLLFGLFWAAMYFMSTGSGDPFLYFQF